MLNSVYQLKKPYQIEVIFKDITLDKEHILVRPTYLSICNADQRYYQGKRSKKVLKEKLPLSLIHEGIGKVVFDPTGTFEVNDTVIMIPNIPTEDDEIIAENYLRTSKFRASSEDGFLQEFICTKPDRLVKLPDNINHAVAAFTEFSSVSYHAIKRFEKNTHSRKNIIGVWGDGNLGYVTSIFLKKLYPDSLIYVFGAVESKLNDFTFADETFLVSDIPKDLKIDHAFECVGGVYSGEAINQIIDYINPEGTISILGVSEETVPINTRMVLEKGIRIVGSSRSGRSDYVGLIKLYNEYPEIVNYLENIINAEIVVNNISDILEAFQNDISKQKGKTIMAWNI